MKKAIILTLGLILISTNVLAYNPDSYSDVEEITVNGKKPKVDIEAQDLIVNIDVEDFINGVAEKNTLITNDGNKSCILEVVLSNVPVDLNVRAFVDTDTLGKGESTVLNIIVELTEQQEVEDFNFTVTINAEML